MSDIRETVPFDQPVPEIHLGRLECARCKSPRSKSQLDYPICAYCYVRVWAKDKNHCVVCKAETDGKHTLCQECFRKWDEFHKKEDH